ncbi:MAG: flagellar basal body rod protein FlgB, partial [Selenomonadaceae bacterium]|nr:flagellar basal body rod protein FlgB [Selenomonadaceae bacterium]
MLEQIMNSTNFNYLPRALTAATIRQEVIANNIANVNTPNY